MFISIETRERTHQKATRSGSTYTQKRTTDFALFQCDHCGQQYERQVGNEVDRRRCHNDVSHYCRDCPSQSLAASKGKATQRKNNEKRHGQRSNTTHGYVSVYVGSSHTSRNVRSGSIFEHVLIVEKTLGREVEVGEVVHHIDGNKQNNDPSNLDVMTVTEHNLCHGRLANELMFDLVVKGIITYDRSTHRYVVR